MTKADLISEIAKSTDISTSDVSAVVEKFMETVRDSLANKENVYLRGFGTFEYRQTKEKKARNISKGETIVIPAHGTVKFKPCKEFKEAVKLTAP